MKSQPSTWEKIFAIHITDKGLVYKMDKEFIKLIAELYIWLEMGKDLDRHVLKENI